MKLAEVLGLGIRLALTAWVAAVAVWDWRRAIIPNRLTLPVVAAVAATRLGQALWYALYLLVLRIDLGSLGRTAFTRWPADPQAPWRLGVILGIWVLIFSLWELNIIGGGDAKLLMGLFALFPTYEFALLFAILVLAVSVPMIIARHWGKRPSDLAAAVADRIGRGRFLPTREELETKGQQYAWTFCLPGVVYLWGFW
jgi:Flp pilus assembly protein protease CpaA